MTLPGFMSVNYSKDLVPDRGMVIVDRPLRPLSVSSDKHLVVPACTKRIDRRDRTTTCLAILINRSTEDNLLSLQTGVGNGGRGMAVYAGNDHFLR